MDNKDIALGYYNPIFASQSTIRDAMKYAYDMARGTKRPAILKEAVHIVHNSFLAKVALGPSDDLVTPDPKYAVYDTVADAILVGYALAKTTKEGYYVIVAMHVVLNSCARHLYPDIEKDNRFDDVVVIQDKETQQDS